MTELSDTLIGRGLVRSLSRSSLRTQGPITPGLKSEKRPLLECRSESPRRMGPCVRRDDLLENSICDSPAWWEGEHRPSSPPRASCQTDMFAETKGLAASQASARNTSSTRCMATFPAFDREAAFYGTWAHNLFAPQIGFQKHKSRFTRDDRIGRNPRPTCPPARLSRASGRRGIGSTILF
jgi:hypothetical protein